jgi:hypothetical protein
MTSPTGRRWIVALSVLATVGVVGAAIGVMDYAAVRAAGRYERERQQLSTDLQRARAQGYTAEDLASIDAAFQSLQGEAAPALPFMRAQFDDGRADRLTALDGELKARLVQLLADARSNALTSAQGARTAIDESRRLGVDEADLAPLRQRLDKLGQTEQAAHSLTEYRAADKEGQTLLSDANAQAAAQQAQNQAVAQAADQLKAQTGGNPDAVRKAGNDALAGGRNDASAAAYLNRSAPFAGLDALNRLEARLERYGQLIGSADLDQSALGAAGSRIVAGQIHDAMVGGLPAKAIIVSYAAQHLWAYQNGKLVEETPVTTGRPALPTDLGPMKVLKKDSPWKMHSPWPKGSPYWYPDTMVKMVVWFTNTGEGLHDADWQRCCWGPGSQYTGNASHGCIHLPDAAETFIYRWAEIGIPVVVYQGDGSPVAQQLSKITTDNKGNPLTGPKGV